MIGLGYHQSTTAFVFNIIPESWQIGDLYSHMMLTASPGSCERRTNLDVRKRGLAREPLGGRNSLLMVE